MRVQLAQEAQDRRVQPHREEAEAVVMMEAAEVVGQPFWAASLIEASLP